MSLNDEVLRAEIFWALKCVKSNFSFATGNTELFSSMFPDSTIAKSYQMSQTKCRYLIQFGIYPWILEDLKEDFKDSPFSFLFDETTTVQIKKQYDAYLRYESKGSGRIVDRYCGSLFLGHCDADHLVTNFCSFGRKMEWQVNYLLQIGMDGPRTNLSFNKKLKASSMSVVAQYIRFTTVSKRLWRNYRLTLTTLQRTFTFFSQEQQRSKRRY